MAEAYKEVPRQDFLQEVISMVDLTPNTIKGIFEERVRELTRQSSIAREDYFDYQLSGGWLQ